MQISVEKYEMLRDRIAILEVANRELRRRLSETASHGMQTVQIINNESEEVIASFTNYPEGIRGIMAKGYRAIVDGQELEIEEGGEKDADD